MILVINGSPYRENSTTLRLTNTFLQGMGETAEVINTVDLHINPCLACYACWMKTAGHCIQQDDAIEVLEKIREADLVIWTVPLYAYAALANCKSLIDRTLCFNKPEIYVGEDGKTHHYGYEDGSKRTVLISSGGLPDIKGNFDGLVFQFKHMYGEQTVAICCAEAALFMYPETQPLTAGYLEAVRKAGAEYKEQGKISEETGQILDTPMIPRVAYIQNTNAAFAQVK
ncbi:MAG: flavodoxin family protein [Lachnospiraceae bacterium]|nr:flavodoxin family protein [Lachnospiraceae bacterium]